jgi:hypothetical protein
MQGKKNDSIADSISYALRLTFGIVHGVLLTLCSFGLALLFPSFSQFLFGLFGFILAPLLSFILTLFCNACIEYVSQSKITATNILKKAWIPPFGIFCVSLLILPLEMMPSFSFAGHLNILVITSVVLNFLITSLLQIYAAKDIQSSVSEESNSVGSSDPR